MWKSLGARVGGIVLLCVLAALPFLAAEAQPATEVAAPRSYVCYKANEPPAIDGRLNDAAWANAPWTEDFVDIEGSKQPNPRYRTRLKMLWDDHALYIGADMEEPHVWATLKDHDSIIFHDPDFEVFLDPDSDNQLYGELEVNALNTTWDLLLTKPYLVGGKPINGWEIAGLRTAVHIDGTINNPNDVDKGWSVEIAWPWKGLREIADTALPPKDGHRWRINFSRVEWDTTIQNGKYEKVKGKPEHNWVWSPQGKIDMHRPHRWGYLHFSSKSTGKMVGQPDPDFAGKNLLHELCYAQLPYKKEHGRFTDQLKNLNFPMDPKFMPRIDLTRRGFEASVLLQGNRWNINQDAVIWRE